MSSAGARFAIKRYAKSKNDETCKPCFNELWLGMMMKKFVILLLAVAFLVAFLPGAGIAGGREWRVHSHYRSPFPGKPDSEISWRFVYKDESGRVRVKVSDAAGRVQSWAVTTLGRDGRIVRLEIYRAVRGGVDRDELFFDPLVPVLLRGSLLPLDWFNLGTPFAPFAGERKCTIREHVAAARFVTHLQIRADEIPVTEAVAAGMVEPDRVDELAGRRLFLVTAARLGNVTEPGIEEAVLFRQLWVEGDTFWLYEEKGLRRSWRESS
jgi:hypothetical protein